MARALTGAGRPPGRREVTTNRQGGA